VKSYGGGVGPIGTPPRRTRARPGSTMATIRPNLGMKVHHVADGDRLPLGNDPRGAVDVAAHQVFEKVIAVEPAASLAKLRDPRPHPPAPARTVTARVAVRSASGTSASPGSTTFNSSSVAPHRKHRALTSATPAAAAPPTATNRPSSHLRQRLTKPPNAVRMLWAGWPPHDALAPVPRASVQREHHAALVVLAPISQWGIHLWRVCGMTERAVVMRSQALAWA
jgi:hypothetical protein